VEDVKFMEHFKGGSSYKTLGTSGLDTVLDYRTGNNITARTLPTQHNTGRLALMGSSRARHHDYEHYLIMRHSSSLKATDY
jgi:hypothetical protein